jgi:putative DNA primase/helicase
MVARNRIMLPQGIGVAPDLYGTDAGAAQLFEERFGDTVRYDHTSGRWLLWDGTVWRGDADGGIYRLAGQVPHLLFEAATVASSADEGKRTAGWGVKLANQAQVEKMLVAARSREGIALTSSDLDADPWLLNTRNGILDLARGTLLPHDRLLHMSRCAGVGYDPRQKTDTWEAFLRRIFLDDRELIEFIQRWGGYCLTGSVREQCMVFFYGVGRNGKTTLVETLQYILGDYAQAAPQSLLTLDPRGRTGQTNDIARLAGVRLAVANETEASAQFAEARLKQLTGGDTLTARFLHQEFFDFTPGHKLILSGNHKPRVSGTDTGVWRRIHLVPFGISIPEQEIDRDLGEKLRAEGSGILAWFADGCLDWLQNGLEPPRSVRQATAEYRQAEDIVGQFLAERCREQPDARCDRAELFTSYRDWAQEQGIKCPLTAQKFNRSIEERDFGLVKVVGRPTWAGLEIER